MTENLSNTASAGEALTAALAHHLPDALNQLDAIAAAAQSRRVALFLDFDGTLAPIVTRPEDAWLSDATRATVERIASLYPAAIVSGRGLEDVRERVGIDRLYYAGSHGFDFAGPDGWRAEYKEGRAYLPALDGAEQALHAVIERIAGVRVERKHFAIAVHYREAQDAEVARIAKAVADVGALHPNLRVSAGKKVWELRPDLDWHKGKAILWLLEQLGLNNGDVLPLFIGDDVTDEDAFRSLRGRGLCIIVDDGSPETPRPTLAEFRLANPEAVRSFLEKFADRVSTVPA